MPVGLGKSGGWGVSLALVGAALVVGCGKKRDFSFAPSVDQPDDGALQMSDSGEGEGLENQVFEDMRAKDEPGALSPIFQGSNSRNAAGKLGECTEGDTEACGPENENGICRFGVRACVGAFWGECEGAKLPGARDCNVSEDNDCDGEPDNTVDEVCTCVPGSIEPCDERPDFDGRGPCRAGERICVLGNGTSTWGACQGSVDPGEADSCSVAGDDSNCDGTPNGGCDCINGQTIGCGPETENGICQQGLSTCVDSAFSECQGAIFPQRRDCRSDQDNDCDGRPDNAVDGVCNCSIGDVESCGEHPGRDGNGACKAGQRACVLGVNNATSRFGACEGSVGPAGADSCSVRGDDSNCDGTPNTACECLGGDRSTCAEQHGSLGVCATRALLCGSNGRWPSASSCVPSSQEVCTNDLDDDCDGQVNETQACSSCVEGCFCENGSCAEIVALDSSSRTTCALSVGGNMWCWGDNTSGQAGLPGFVNERRPRRLEGLQAIQSVAVGSRFSCALHADQTVGCWGANDGGQLGDNGATASSFLPVAVLTAPNTPLTGVVKIVAGSTFACALRGVDGAVLCWGANGGLLSSPVAIPMLRSANVALVRVSDLEAEAGVVLARTGNVWLSWGISRGALGQGAVNSSALAIQIASQPQSGFVSTAVGSNNGCGTTALGGVYCWGNDVVLSGLGSGAVETPVAFSMLDRSVQIALSARLGFAIDDRGILRVFGNPGASSIAGLSESDVPAGTILQPIRVQGLSAVKQISVSAESACALQIDDTAHCWGRNVSGELGDGSLSSFSYLPVKALPAQP